MQLRLINQWSYQNAWLLLFLKNTLQNAMQNKSLSTLVPHFPCCSRCSISVTIQIIINIIRCAIICNPISAFFVMFALSCYVLLMFRSPISYVKCFCHIIPFQLIGLSYYRQSYKSNFNLDFLRIFFQPISQLLLIDVYSSCP